MRKILYYDSCFAVTKDNYDVFCQMASSAKPKQIKLLNKTIDFLTKINVPYWLSHGILLAAYRDNGVMIRHDVDTDIGILESELQKIKVNLHLFSNHDNDDDVSKLNKHGYNINISSSFDNNGNEIKFTPSENSYKRIKIEDLSSEEMYVKERNHKYRLVACDIYTFSQDEDNPDLLRNNYTTLSGQDYLRPIAKHVIFPLQKMVFEGRNYFCPNDPKTYLETFYGYIGKGAFYNPETKLYEK